MRWKDFDTKWKSLAIRDKVEGEGERLIPLTPYVFHLLASLPRRSEWVFSSSIIGRDKVSKPISKPHQVHDKVCTVAEIEDLTLHGLVCRCRCFGVQVQCLRKNIDVAKSTLACLSCTYRVCS